METELITSQLTARFKSKIHYTDTCWIWTASRSTTGYGQLFVCRIDSRRNIVQRAHRISWLIHKGSIPSHQQVLHKCDVRLCVNPDHLYLGTQQDNVNDMMSKCRNSYWRRQGEQHPRAKLTDNQVRCVKHRLHIGIDRRTLAQEFNVSLSSIGMIANGHTWRHI